MSKSFKNYPVSSHEQSSNSLLLAELSVLHELSALVFTDSEEQLAGEAVEKAIRLFAVRYFAAISGLSKKQRLITSVGFESLEEALAGIKRLEHDPRTLNLVFNKDSDGQSIIFFMHSSKIDDRTRRLYKIFAHRLENRIAAFHLQEKNRQAQAMIQESAERAQVQRMAIAELALDQGIASGDIAASIKKIVTTVAKAIKVDRARVWLLSDNGCRLECIFFYQSGKEELCKGNNFKTSDFPSYFQAIAADSRINAHDAHTDPRTCELTQKYLIPMGITSLLDAAIQKEGRMAGVFSLEHTGEKRKWHPDEEAFASTAAALVSQALSNAERKRAEEDLKESRQRFEYLLQSTARNKSFHNIIGRSKQIQKVYATIRQVAGVDTTILITGETGTGKELIAEALHALSPRSKGPLIKVNCLTLSDDLLDSELFGHVKGAFTGAYSNKIGRVEAAEGGTLFLDEIGDLTPRIQLKLLRFLQQKEYERVGESITRKTDVRILAATNADLASKINDGSFRKDLYFRIKVLNIHVPPLRERTEDIPLLMDHFRKFFSEKFGKNIKGVRPEVMKLMLKYTWPGNVRELEHVLEHGTLLCPEGLIDMKHLPEELLDQEQTVPQLQTEAASVNREDLIKALEATKGKKTDAARMLGISRRTLYRKLHEYGFFE